MSVLKGRSECLQLLLDAEADVNVKDRAGETPLTVACRTGKRYFLELLTNYSKHHTF
jgi:ankyrin repeat protein